MLTDDPRWPPSRAGRPAKESTFRHLYAVPDDDLREGDLKARVDHLAARVAAGDQMLAELKGRLDALKARLDAVAGRQASGLEARQWSADLERAEASVAAAEAAYGGARASVLESSGVRFKAAVAGAVTALLAAYWAVGWAWRAVAPGWLAGGA